MPIMVASKSEVTEPMHDAAAIERFLIAELTAAFRRPMEPTVPLVRLGLESSTLVGVVAQLEKFLGRPVEMEIFWDQPTLRAVAETLAAEGARG